MVAHGGSEGGDAECCLLWLVIECGTSDMAGFYAVIEIRVPSDMAAHGPWVLEGGAAECCLVWLVIECGSSDMAGFIAVIEIGSSDMAGYINDVVVRYLDV